MENQESKVKRISAEDILIIDDDFDQAASYYAGQAFGSDKASTLIELKRRYNEDEDLDSLVFILARHRCTHNPTAPKEPFYVDKNSDRPFEVQTIIEDLVPACSEPWIPGIKEMRRALMWRFYDALVNGVPDYREKAAKEELKTTLAFIKELPNPESLGFKILEGLTQALAHARGEDVGATVTTHTVTPQDNETGIDKDAYTKAIEFGVMGQLYYPNQEGTTAMEAGIRAGISRYVSLTQNRVIHPDT